jgi:carbamate kinase
VQQELGAERVPELPLFVLGAMTQGQLGSLLELSLRGRCGPQSPGVVSMLTHMVVDEADPAFTHPTKPIGPFLSESEARRQASERGWLVGEDAGRGYRRLVPSPRPLRIVELDAVRALIDQRLTVIAAGGGGVPVVLDGSGYRGVEAVIDKDLGAALLAGAVGADVLVIGTDVPHAVLRYGTPEAEDIGTVTVSRMRGYAADGHFASGSMGPKVEAACRFVERGGSRAVITDLDHLTDAVAADPARAAGTVVVPG